MKPESEKMTGPSVLLSYCHTLAPLTSTSYEETSYLAEY